jgi:hypothetical protein
VRRSIPLLPAVAGLLALAAACTTDVPSAPPSAIGPSLAISIAYPSCDPSGIRSTMASLYRTTDLKKFALPTFNKAESFRQAGNLPAARTQYFALVDHLLAKFRGDLLLQPSKLASIQDGVFFVTASVLACAGDPPIDDLESLIEGIGNDSPNYEICVVLLNPDGTYKSPVPDGDGRIACVVPSKGAALKLEAKFLAQEALLLLQPDLGDLDDELFEETLGTTWSDVWRLRIEPKTAQRNYPGTSWPVVTPTPKGHAAVCTIEKFDDFHPALANDAFLRLGYRANQQSVAAVILPESNLATTLLDCPSYELVWEQGPGTSAIGAVPVLDSWPGRLALRGLRGAGRQFAGLFTATPLYAFDGGIGGAFNFGDSYYSAVERQRVYIRLDPSDAIDGPQPTISIPQAGTEKVQASRTAFGLVRYPESCTWTSSERRVTVTPASTTETVTKYDTNGLPIYVNGVLQTEVVTRVDVLATLTATRSPGTAIVTASCLYKNATTTSATTVTVTN